MSSIIRHEDENNKGVLNYEPKHIEMEMPSAAKNFINEQPVDNKQSFIIDEIVSKQTGIFETEKKRIETEINERVVDKIKDIQEKAYKEAYELGLQEGKKLAFENNLESIKLQLEELKTLFENLKNMKKKLLDANESLILDMVYYAAEKVVIEHVEKKDDAIKEVIKQVVDSLETKETITVRLNDQDYDVVQKFIQESNQESDIYKKLKFYVSSEIEKGGCLFETDHGLVDATLRERLDKLWIVLNQTKPQK